MRPYFKTKEFIKLRAVKITLECRYVFQNTLKFLRQQYGFKPFKIILECR